eukprot:m.102992 g.102992  ORF g.102992 m.102992 type:complete len:144 (+) comp9037_c0_seq1:146-577(+)
MTDLSADELLGQRWQLAASGTNVYAALYTQVMAAAPSQIGAFADRRLDEDTRALLVAWIRCDQLSMFSQTLPGVPRSLTDCRWDARDLENPLSPQSLQIKFSFSVPSDAALEAIAALPGPVLSAGHWILGGAAPRSLCVSLSL